MCAGRGWCYDSRPMKIRSVAICAALLTVVGVAVTVARADSVMQMLPFPQSAIRAGGVTVVITPTSLVGAPGREIDVSADFVIPSGWHIYGKPLPEGYTPTAITMESNAIASQSFQFPKPEMVTFAGLGETMPVYKDTVRAAGKLRLRKDLKPGNYSVLAKVEFQECNDTICKLPQSASTTIALVIKSAH